MKTKLFIGLLVLIALIASFFLYTDTKNITTTQNTTPASNTEITADIELRETTTITEGGTHVLTGTITDGQVIVNVGEEDTTLVLNGVDITNSTGAAIYVASAGTVTIELADNSTNKLVQTGMDTDEEEKAALYSTSDLEITGEGALYAESTVADGISTGDNLVLTSGNITVVSADDGIRGKDSLTVAGGTIVVTAQGDGIKSTNDEELGKGILTILDGDLTITSADDAIKAEQAIVIDGGTIAVPMSVESIEAPVITINDGTITIYATDDGINASASEIITTGLSITINGGVLEVEVGDGDTDGIDSNGSIFINGGIVKITNTSIGSGPAAAFDYDDVAEFNGGTIYINGVQVDEIPTGQMGGPGGMRSF